MFSKMAPGFLPTIGLDRGTLMENLWTNGRLLAWGEASRRGALRLLGSAGLISLVGLSAEDAEAKKKKHHKKKKKKNNNPSPPPPPPPTPALTFPLTRATAAPG